MMFRYTHLRYDVYIYTYIVIVIDVIGRETGINLVRVPANMFPVALDSP